MRKSIRIKRFSAAILLTAMFVFSWNSGAVCASATDGYLVYKSSDLTAPQATVSTLSDAFTYVNSNAGSDAWTIKVTADDPSVGAAATLNAPGATVTLTCDSQHILSQTTAGVRHIQAVAGTLNLENIILDGASAGGGLLIGSGVTASLNANAVVQNCKASQGGGIYNSGSLTLNSGSKVSGCQSTFSGTGGSGAGIYSTGPVALNDGCLVTGNTANGGKGGGIAMCLNGAVLTMNGGEISGNTVTGYSTDFMGGGAVLYCGAILNMYAGKICGNTADIGAGVSVYDASAGTGSCFTMYGGEIFGNTATYSGGTSHGMGGGIFAWSWAPSSFTMEGGLIHDNTARFGGGIATYDSITITLNHGAINKNTSSYAGGVYLTGSATMNNDFRVSDNTATYYGGGVYVLGTLVMNDHAEISGNTTGYQGGGVFLYLAGTGIMNSGVITGNKAGTSGGGIALWGTNRLCSFTMNAAGAPKLYGNMAYTSGDDVYGNGAAMSITLSKVTDMALPDSVVAVNWYNDPAAARYRDLNAVKTVFSDTSLTAITNAVQLTIGMLYRVSYDANGGTGSKTEQVTPTVSYSVLTTGDAGISRIGYTFNEWNTSSDGSGTPYSPGNVISIAEDVKLFAQWSPIPYTVSFDSQGGTAVSSQTSNFGTAATKPSDPTKTGNTFSGWYKDAACTEQWDFAKDMVTGDTVLFAKWTPIVYGVTFDSQGGSAVSSQNVNAGTAATKPSDPTKTGNTFSGWYKDAACTEQWDFAKDMVTGKITLYAKWTKLEKAVLSAAVATKTGESGTSAAFLCGIAALTASLGLSAAVYQRRKNRAGK